ncbi:MAG: efflux RND transporter permease subunit [Polyangiales bacterium]
MTPRSLNRFEQLNFGEAERRLDSHLDDALTFLETRARRRSCRPRIRRATPASRAKPGGGRLLRPAFALAVVLIFLVLAAQFDSFRDPFVILAGSVPLAMFGALALLTFLKMPNPNMSY